MNLIITKFRSSLENKNSSTLMTTILNALPVAEYDPKEAIDKWYFSAKATRQ
jgi:hypothetical protein